MEAIYVVAIAVIALLSLAVLAGYIGIFNTSIKGPVNVRAVNAWVQEQAAISKGKSATPFIEGSTSYPPVPVLDDPVEITSVNQIKNPDAVDSAYRIMADSMLDCWNAFGANNINFLAKQRIFCFPCRQITFSDSVKKEIKQINGFNTYLAKSSPYVGQNQKSYLELMGGNPSIPPTDVSISTDKPVYIFFGATNGIPWGTVIAYGLAGGAVAAVGAPVLAIVAGGAGLASLATISAGSAIGGAGATTAVIAVYEKFLNSTEFSSTILIGDDNAILAFCNPESTSQQVQAQKGPIGPADKCSEVHIALMKESYPDDCVKVPGCSWIPTYEMPFGYKDVVRQQTNYVTVGICKSTNTLTLAELCKSTSPYFTCSTQELNTCKSACIQNQKCKYDDSLGCIPK